MATLPQEGPDVNSSHVPTCLFIPRRNHLGISSEEGMLSWLQMLTVYRAVMVAEGPEMAQGHGATWRNAWDKGTPEVQPQL